MEEQTQKDVMKKLHVAVAEYKMPQHARELIGSGEVTIFCGVTAAGKNTIINYLLKSGDYQHVISHTTRKPRVNDGVPEENGKQYWFVSPSELLDMVENKEFIEVKAIHGETCYGTSTQAVDIVLDANKHPLMEIDVQGALELTEAVPNLRPLFILPPSFEVWMERMQKRGGLDNEDKRRRFLSATMEIETALDHPAFVLVVNHEVDETAVEIINGIDTSEEAQAERRKLAEELLEKVRQLKEIDE